MLGFLSDPVVLINLSLRVTHSRMSRFSASLCTVFRRSSGTALLYDLLISGVERNSGSGAAFAAELGSLLPFMIRRCRLTRLGVLSHDLLLLRRVLFLQVGKQAHVFA